MSTTTAPRDDIATIIEKTKPRPPGKCHTFDHRGWALCGVFRRVDGNGEPDLSGLHTQGECKARGHRHCAVCRELRRQLSGDWMVA